jgi:hypothetical protein
MGQNGRPRSSRNHHRTGRRDSYLAAAIPPIGINHFLIFCRYFSVGRMCGSCTAVMSSLRVCELELCRRGFAAHGCRGTNIRGAFRS